jgi:hypothetical protein
MRPLLQLHSRLLRAHLRCVHRLSGHRSVRGLLHAATSSAISAKDDSFTCRRARGKRPESKHLARMHSRMRFGARRAASILR